MIIIINIYICNKKTHMASIALRNVPEELHRAIKRLQLDYEEDGKIYSLENLYIEVLKSGIEKIKDEKPSK